MFFLLRTAVVIAVIFHFSPVREPAPGADGGTGIAPEIIAQLNDGLYESWTALPPHARERLTMEIARQLADAARSE